MTPPLLSTATRYFMEVARCGSLTEAARRVHVAPSALSRQVARLEQELGCTLFERQARGMVLTEAGERLLAWARTAAQDTERVAQALRGLAGLQAQRLHLGCTEGFADGFLPGPMARLREVFPGTAIHLRVGAPEAVSRWLLRGEVDLGLKFALAPEPGLRVEHACAAPILAVVAPGHPLARRRRIAVAELVRHPLALPEAGTTVRDALDQACAAQGLAYELAFTGNFGALQALAARGQVVTLASRIGVAHLVAAGHVVARPVDGEMFTGRRVTLLALQDRVLGERLQSFAQMLGQAVELASAGQREGRARGQSPAGRR